MRQIELNNEEKKIVFDLYTLKFYSLRKIEDITGIERHLASQYLKNKDVEIEANRSLYQRLEKLNSSLTYVLNFCNEFILIDSKYDRNFYMSLNPFLKIFVLLSQYDNQQPSYIGQLDNVEGSETREMSPNNNSLQECPKSSCGKTIKLEKCEYCNNIFLSFRETNRGNSTCTKKCQYLLNTKTRTDKANERGYWYSEIQIANMRDGWKKSIKIRKENGTYRNGSKKYYDTTPEITFESLIKSRNIEYVKQLRINWFLYDFYLPEKNLIVEIQGDYWHGNPKFYPILSKYQKARKIKDKEKRTLAKNKGYNYCVIWENNLRSYHKELYEIVRTTKKLVELENKESLR